MEPDKFQLTQAFSLALAVATDRRVLGKKQAEIQRVRDKLAPLERDETLLLLQCARSEQLLEDTIKDWNEEDRQLVIKIMNT